MTEEFGGMGLQEEIEKVGFEELPGFSTDHLMHQNGHVTPIESDEEEYVPPSSDSAWDGELNLKKHKEVWKKTNPPGGTYFVESFKASEKTTETEYYVATEDGFELVKKPRTITTYTGKGVIEKDGKTWDTRVMIRVSPIEAYAKFKDGTVNAQKVDTAYRFFQLAIIAYEFVLGEEPKYLRSIDEFLQSNSFNCTCFQLPDGTLLFNGLKGIKAA